MGNEKDINTDLGGTDEPYSQTEHPHESSGRLDAVIASGEESLLAGSPGITARMAVRFLPPVAAVVLQSLGQHQLLSVRHVRTLHMPHVSLRYTQRVLAELHDAGLIGRANARHGTALWFLTPAGHAALHGAGRRSSKAHAANPEHIWMRRTHIQAVNETGIAFLQAARERGDECDAFSWQHDVAHALTPARQGRKQQWLVVDALLSYIETQHEPPLLHQRFIAVDRATSDASRLVNQLASYKLLHQCAYPANESAQATAFSWCEHYRAFPGLLAVLVDQEPVAAQRRIRNIIDLWHSDPATRELEEISLQLTTLDQLVSRGPGAPIFTNASRPEQAENWLGHPAAADDQ